MTEVFRSNRYTVRADCAGGFVLLRNSDGASVYFQPGDDASAFWRELKAAEAAGNGSVWAEMHNADVILSEYDHVLEQEE